MTDLPGDVASSIVRALGAYIRAAKAEELPGPLRRFKGYRPQALTRHRSELIAALDDAGLRGRVLEWLDRSHPRLASKDVERLRVACARTGNWEQELARRSTSPKKSAPATTGSDASMRARMERERALVKKAREEARRATEEARRALQTERAVVAGLKEQIADLKSQLATASSDARTARTAARRASEQLEREQRKTRAAAQKSIAEVDRLRKELKKLRSTSASQGPPVAEPRRPASQSAAGAPKPTRGTRGPRRPLRAPKGRLQDDPETLEEWLDEPSVALLIDGYNVTKSRGGFGHLELAGQRDRLVEAVAKLARSKDVPTIVVFDGSDVPAGNRRRPRGPASVEYSRASETADDHLVALLAKLPPEPVVLVTNDRDLQTRASGHGATIATSRQLLALIR